MSRSEPPGASARPAQPVNEDPREGLYRRMVKALVAANPLTAGARADRAQHGIEALQVELRSLAAAVRDLAQGLGAVQREMELLRDERVPTVETRLDHAIERGDERHDALQMALEQRQDRAEATARTLQTAIEQLRDELLPALVARENALVDRLADELDEQASLLARHLRDEPLRLPPIPSPATHTTSGSEHEESAPAARRDVGSGIGGVLPVLLNALERDSVDSSGLQEPAHRLDEVVQALAGRQPVLDLGCGRGELLGRLRELGLEATGVEAEPALAAEALRRGLAVEVGDPLAALEARAGAALGAVTAVHLLERLTPETVLRLLALAREALADGGVLVARILNPACPESAVRFWRDPRNLRPLVPETLAGLLEACGYEVLQGRQPRTGADPPRVVVVSARRGRQP